ncbi:hypothetical protein DPMN_051734 [Dreissena polymorpha]|uniref:Uncharacterized protein n=1 Tax=Dreissena polymorpha TaxID=45954 RepID=A0A9D4CJI5_DREPO|nr:hypothetical protein DPMN_051734 [Dreissena polymorpha]
MRQCINVAGLRVHSDMNGAFAYFSAKNRLCNDICEDLTSAGVAFLNSMPDAAFRKHVEVIAEETQRAIQASS